MLFFSIPETELKLCGATGAMRFSVCVASAAHTFFRGNRKMSGSKGRPFDSVTVNENTVTLLCGDTTVVLERINESSVKMISTNGSQVLVDGVFGVMDE